MCGEVNLKDLTQIFHIRARGATLFWAISFFFLAKYNLMINWGIYVLSDTLGKLFNFIIYNSCHDTEKLN